MIQNVNLKVNQRMTTLYVENMFARKYLNYLKGVYPKQSEEDQN